MQLLNSFVSETGILDPRYQTSSLKANDYDNARPFFFQKGCGYNHKTVIRSNNNLNIQATYQ